MTKPPLTDDEAEMLLQNLMRQIAEAHGETEAGQNAIRIAMAGVYAALINLESSTRPSPLPRRPLD